MTAKKKPAPPRPKPLFAEPAKPSAIYTAYIDGASRGNPGPAAYGVIFYRPDGSKMKELPKYIGIKTNNEAEYYALIAALDFALASGVRHLAVRSDSELLVRQMQGSYKVRHPKLRPLFEQAQRLARRLEYFSVEHIPRDLNLAADALANQTLDQLGRTQPRGNEVQAATFALAGTTRDAPGGSGQDGLRISRRVKARWLKGALHPAEPLELSEGSEVEITIHPRKT
jgi:probable phosphoglycerate mutase